MSRSPSPSRKWRLRKLQWMTPRHKTGSWQRWVLEPELGVSKGCLLLYQALPPKDAFLGYPLRCFQLQFITEWGCFWQLRDSFYATVTHFCTSQPRPFLWLGLPIHTGWSLPPSCHLTLPSSCSVLSQHFLLLLISLLSFLNKHLPYLPVFFFSSKRSPCKTHLPFTCKLSWLEKWFEWLWRSHFTLHCVFLRPVRTLPQMVSLAPVGCDHRQTRSLPLPLQIRLLWCLSSCELCFHIRLSCSFRHATLLLSLCFC